MTKVVLITAQPRTVSSGATTTIRLAGGGNSKPYYYGGNHYRSGVAQLPRLRAEFGFDEEGWNGGVVPVTGVLTFAPYSAAVLAELAAYFWRGAAITVQEGEEDTASFTTRLTGKVADASVQDHKLILTIADLGAALDKPLVTARFAGTGGAEGGSEAAQRIKRRTWGRAFNIEGRVLNKANNIYEFGDPAYPWQEFTTLRDKGRAASPAPTIVTWQGSVAATLTALIASIPAQGSGVVAPSIACVKWWTQPAGPLTADVKGEVGSGYVETAASIAERILSAAAGPSITNVATANGWRSGVVGIHVDENDSIASVLDRLLMGVSLLWILDAAGTITLREITFTGSVASLTSDTVQRLRTLPPIKTRRVGYQKSYRIHGDGEIAASLLQLDPEAGTTLTALEDGTAPIVSRLNPDTGAAESNFIAADGNPYSRIVASGDARDGDAITFPTTLPEVPTISFLPGGNAATAGQNIAIQAVGLTVSGFTMKAKSQSVTAGSTITDTGSAAGGGGEPDLVINRTDGGTPFDGKFTFRYSVTVGNIAPGEPGYVSVGLFVKVGGAWVQVATRTHNATGTFDVAVSPGTVDFGAGSEFGVDLLAAEGAGSVLSSFARVVYTLGTVSETSLTPVGASSIPWVALL